MKKPAPTISPPTKATRLFAEKEGWQLVVVGDRQTPEAEYQDLDCVYLGVREQEELGKELSDAIGWGCIQRRNMGFVYAYRMGAEVVATVDDDNIPYADWGEDVYVGDEVEVDLWEPANGVFDPLSVTGERELWHRGYPIEFLASRGDVRHVGRGRRKVLVQADLWDGDPDVDALCRIALRPSVKFDVRSPYGSDCKSPFNSQNTFLHRSVLPHYMVLPGVGRMDDIWGSYLAQDFCRGQVIYNRASVIQERNAHDPLRDLEEELLGYRNTLGLLQGTYHLPKRTADALELYRAAF